MTRLPRSMGDRCRLGWRVSRAVGLLMVLVGGILVVGSGLFAGEPGLGVDWLWLRAGAAVLFAGAVAAGLGSMLLLGRCSSARLGLETGLREALLCSSRDNECSCSSCDLDDVLSHVRSISKEQDLRERRLQAIIDTEPECVKTVASDGTLLEMNPAGLRLVGADDLSEVQGLSVFDLIDPEDRDRYCEMHRRVMEGEPQTLTFRVIGLTGVKRWLETHAVPLRNDEGHVESHLAITRDITEALEREEALDRAKAEAEAANCAKSQFLANMSHELRTPLTAILGYTEILGDDSQPPELRREHLRVLERNGKHLLELISDILDLTKVEAGEVPVSLETMSVRTVVDDIGAMMSGRSSEKGIEFTVEIDAGVPDEIWTDKLWVRQILVNLIGNALKFTPSGSVSVRVYGEEDGGQIRFEVRDTGIGIPAARMGSIFEPFQQVDDSTTRRFGGTGLGLSISRQLAEFLGGHIEVESVVGEGSVFTFTLPCTLPKTQVGLAAAMPNDRLNDPGSKDEPLCGLRICLAEDGEDNQRLIQLVLSAAGAEVMVAGNGEEAVELVSHDTRRGVSIDLVLMDMQMPVMSGEEATRRIRELGWDGPIVALTAHATESWRDRCLECGASDYLTKPFAHGALIEKIWEWHTKSRAA